MRGQAARLRPLAPARPDRLGLGRRAAGVQAARRTISSARASITAPAANGGSRRRASLGGARRRCARRRRDGHPGDADFNTGDNDGVGYFHVNQKRGVRWSAARGFLKPVLQPPESAAGDRRAGRARVFEGKRASGVRFRRERRSCVERARSGEVILCGGRGRLAADPAAFRRRPGRAARRARHRVVLDTARRRRAICRTICSSARSTSVSGVRTLNEHLSLAAAARAGWALEYALFRRGPLTMAPSQLGIFTRSSIRRRSAPTSSSTSSRCRSTSSASRCTASRPSRSAACNLRPTSRGTIRLALGRSARARR